MATSATHRGWKRNIGSARMAALYDGTTVFDFDANDLAVAQATQFASTVGVTGAATFTDDITVQGGDVNVGVAGTTLGKLNLKGSTSGTVTVQAAAAAGDISFELPAAVGSNGQQLTTNGNASAATLSWASAGSVREVKHILGQLADNEALQRVLGATVYRFKYRDDPDPEISGFTTHDYETEYVGIMADEAPWAMHHDGRIFNPVSAFGHAIGAIQALIARVDELEARLSAQGV